MGLLDLFLQRSKKTETHLELETLLDLITISNKSFQKIKKGLERIIFQHEIISYDIPIEYQEYEVLLQKEYDNRYCISTGIISLAIIEYLLLKRANNPHNNSVLNASKMEIFPNLLKIREQIIYSKSEINNERYSFFYDSEERILNTEENYNKFSSLISQLSLEIKNFIESNFNMNNVRNYFNVRMGQIFPEFLEERDEEIWELIKNKIKAITNDLEINFFNQL